MLKPLLIDADKLSRLISLIFLLSSRVSSILWKLKIGLFLLSCRAGNAEEETGKVEEVSDDLEIRKHQAEEACDDLEIMRNQVAGKSRHDKKMVSPVFRGWFLYSRLSSKEQLKFERQANKSKWGFIGCLRSFVQFCDKRHPSYSSRVSQVGI